MAAISSTPPEKTSCVLTKVSFEDPDERINIGPALPRWSALRAAKGLQLDSELALLLLDAYEKGPWPSTPWTTPRLVVKTPVVTASTCPGAATDARPQMADETIHGPEEMQLPAELHKVLTEEDIVGSRASVVYEESLRQLATLLHLPVKRCRYRMSTGLMCFGLPPFQCLIQQRCTAFVVEWVCPRGHVVWSWTSQPTFKFGMLAGDFMLGTNILLSGSNYSKVALLFRFMNMGVVSPATFSKIQDTYCVDTIREFWMERRSQGVQWLQGKDVVVVGGEQSDSADVRKVIVVKEEQQDWSSSLDQEDPEPPHIKEEQEELWTSQEGDQLQGLEEAGIKFSFTSFTVKSDDDEEEAQSSQLHQRQTEQMETEADAEDCGGSEPDRKSDPEPDRNSEPDPDEENGDSFEPETDNSVDWKETREPQLGLNSLKKIEEATSDEIPKTHKKPFSCSDCGKRFPSRTQLTVHVRIHTGEKPFSCTVCGQRFNQKSNLIRHMPRHTGEKPFSCSVCKKRFKHQGDVGRHMKIHIKNKQSTSCVGYSETKNTRREPPDLNTPTNNTASVKGQSPGRKSHTCSECGKRFGNMSSLKVHMRVHTGEKPFSCSVCGEGFTQKANLLRHMSRHTGEKPYACSVCKKRFRFAGDVVRHMKVHKRETPSSSLDQEDPEPPHIKEDPELHTLKRTRRTQSPHTLKRTRRPHTLKRTQSPTH